MKDTDELTSLLGICGGITLAFRSAKDGQVQVTLTVSGEESNGSTLRTGTTSSADTMDVILGVVGVVIVEHVSNVAHILFEGPWLAIAGFGITTFQNGRRTRISRYVL